MFSFTLFITQLLLFGAKNSLVSEMCIPLINCTFYHCPPLFLLTMEAIHLQQCNTAYFWMHHAFCIVTGFMTEMLLHCSSFAIQCEDQNIQSVMAS